ncbi:class I adenylate-forming enzyme family protein [Sphingopyxis sp. FD7]|uniref:class I adenylate-forming enzyme family protein n=1 Tax=Sphingopyxis sp. FD7 TaxID=1914525 RepID=UPI000DC63945|nr:AMP-binding protein [Sphingopyxis sp. FD7]BBB14401.1 AMP-dependent synthetase [Sphingopyxis sp. FD7]
MASITDRQAALTARFPEWRPHTLPGALDHAAAEFPDRPFVITDARSWTYAEMRDWSIRLAHGLIAKGLKPGDHVALVMANLPEFVAIKYAIARAGGVAVPVNMMNRRDELGYVLRQSDAAMLVTMDRFRDLDYLQMLDELAPDWEAKDGGDAFPRLKRIIVYPTDRPRAGATSFAALDQAIGDILPTADPHGVADIIYTSGTTGSPKGVLLTHDMLLRAAWCSAYARAFEDGHRILFSLPMYHVYGYVEGLLSVPFVGGAIVPQLKFDAAATIDSIKRHRPTDLLLIPAMTLAIIDALRQRSGDVSSVRAVLSSGGRAPPSIWQAIQDQFGPVEITTGYGMSECTASTTVTRPDDPLARLLATNGRLRDAGVAGDPALGGKLVEYQVVDPHNGDVLEPGQVGELMARGPGVTSGYYNKPEATAAAFDDEGWFHTGDLGRIDEDDYLTLVGRLKECYRCGGEQVIPADAEDVLAQHPAVSQAHVVPVPDERMGEVGVAFVVLKTGTSVQTDELVTLMSERLARFKVPRHVIFIDEREVPVTPSGRSRKFLLSQRAVELLELAT